MRRLALFALPLFALTAPSVSQPALAQDEACPIPAPEGQRTEIAKRGEGVMYENECGERYETGYRLEGKTLSFPAGGRHSLPQATEEMAQKTLRDTYGLIGDGPGVIRTKW